MTLTVSVVVVVVAVLRGLRGDLRLALNGQLDGELMLALDPVYSWSGQEQRPRFVVNLVLLLPLCEGTNKGCRS